MNNPIFRRFLVLCCLLVTLLSGCSTQQFSAEHQEIIYSTVDHFHAATPIEPIPPGSLTEDDAYKIADAYVSQLMLTEGVVCGYKIGSFEAGKFDNGPVDGFSGPITAVMFASGLHPSGHRVDFDCCNFTFVEADFAAEVGSAAINDAHTDLEILAALSGFRPFIEMPDILITNSGGSKYSAIATNFDFRNGIYGDLINIPATPTGLSRLRSFRYELTNEQGLVLGEGEIGAAYDPVYRVRALRDRILERGRTLQPGDLLSLGNMGTIRPLKPGVFMLNRPRFEGNQATLTYFGLAAAGPVRAIVHIDRNQ